MKQAEVTPRLEIDLNKIRHNSAHLCEKLAPRGIGITGVTKVALGDPRVATALLQGGVTSLGDSRIRNIRKMRHGGVNAEFILLRSPQLSRVDDVVRYVDISLNSELDVIIGLSQAAQRQRRTHRILLMVELGDLREGIPLNELDQVIEHCLKLPNIIIEGIGTNLTCLSGVKPDSTNMGKLSDTAETLREKYGLELKTVSGGNSSSLDWLCNTDQPGAINNLRLGEAILLGCDPLNRQGLSDMYQNAITLVTEVIEAKVKPSVPEGQLAQNAFGESPTFIERGNIQRSILDIGQQDIQLDGITPEISALDIIGASSDHLVLDSSRHPLQVGSQIRFKLSYSALLAAMTSPFVEKVFVDSPNHG